MDTKERILAQHFRVPVLKVEGFMWSCGRGVDRKVIIRSVCNGVDGRLIIIGVRDREVGQSGDASGRGLGDGSDRRCRNRA